jgi:hypothetical protein
VVAETTEFLPMTRFAEPRMGRAKWTATGAAVATCIALFACGNTDAERNPTAGNAGNAGSAGNSGRAGSGGELLSSGGTNGSGGQSNSGGNATSSGGTPGSGGDSNVAGTTSGGGTGGATANGGAAGAGTGGISGAGTGGNVSGVGGRSSTGGATSCDVADGSEIGTLHDPVVAASVAPPDPPGIAFMDTDGVAVNAHGGGVIRVCDTFYLHGEYFSSTTTDNDFNGFSMYSSKNLSTWKNEGIILPRQASGELGPSRKGERPHIIQCPSTGEFVLYAHAADTTYQADKEVVFATSSTVNGKYAFQGPLKNASGAIAAHSDMSALTDGSNAYVVTESGWVYTLAADCHSWASSRQFGAVNGTTGGIEAPTIFKAGSTFYWIGSDKTGWRANDDFYSTAPAMSGPWTYHGYLAPQGKLTWMTQSTWVIAVAGSRGTTYVYWGDHWYGNQDTSAPGKHNNLTTYVFQPLVFTGTEISLPTYQTSWTLDVGAGTWSK